MQGDARRRRMRQREVWTFRPDGQWGDRLRLVRVLIPVHRPAVPFLSCQPTAGNEPTEPKARHFQGATGDRNAAKPHPQHSRAAWRAHPLFTHSAHKVGVQQDAGITYAT